MAKRKTPEADLQKAVCKFLGFALGRGIVWLHPANERSNKIERMRLASLGVVPGVADLLFLWYEGHGAIELKAPGRKQSDEQIAWAALYKKTGGLYAVCKTVGAVEDALREWGLPLKASTRARR